MEYRGIEPEYRVYLSGVGCFEVMLAQSLDLIGRNLIVNHYSRQGAHVLYAPISLCQVTGLHIKPSTSTSEKRSRPLLKAEAEFPSFWFHLLKSEPNRAGVESCPDKIRELSLRMEHV